MGFDRKWYGDHEHARGAADTGPTEFSWGPGLVPPGYDSAPPSEGGMYRPKPPSMIDPPRKARHSDPPRGYPGEIIAG